MARRLHGLCKEPGFAIAAIDGTTFFADLLLYRDKAHGGNTGVELHALIKR
jgi:hypothetical protein